MQCYHFCECVVMTYVILTTWTLTSSFGVFSLSYHVSILSSSTSDFLVVEKESFTCVHRNKYHTVTSQLKNSQVKQEWLMMNECWMKGNEWWWGRDDRYQTWIEELTNSDWRSLEKPCILEDCFVTLSKRSTTARTWHSICTKAWIRAVSTLMEKSSSTPVKEWQNQLGKMW